MFLKDCNIIVVWTWIVLCSGCAPDQEDKNDPIIKPLKVIKAELGLEKGLKYYQGLRQQFIQKRAWRQVARCQNKISECQEALGYLDEALQEVKANLGFIQDQLPPQDTVMTNTRHLLAQMYRRRNLPEKAIRELKWILHYQAPKPEQAITFYNSIGSIYQDLGKSFLAKEYHLKALRILKQSNLNESIVIKQVSATYALLASACGRNKQSQKAIDYYKLALATGKKNDGQSRLSVAILHNNIGLNYSIQNRYDSAKYFFQASIKMLNEDENKPFRHLISGIYNNLGELYLKQNQYETSRTFFRKALQIRQQKFGATSWQVADCYHYLGLSYQKQNLHQAALDAFQQALMANDPKFEQANILVNPSIPNSLDKNSLLQTLQAKSRSLKKHSNTSLEKLQTALVSTLTCDTIIDKALDESFKNQDKIRWSQKSAANSSQAVDIAYRLSQLQPQKRKYYLDQAFYFAEQNKASVLSSSLAEVDARKFAGIPDSLLAKEKQLRVDINFFKNRLLRNPGKKATYYEGKVFDLNRSYEDLIQLLEKEYAHYYALKYERKVVTLETIQRKLAPKTALLQYITGEDQSYVFVVTHDAIHLQPLAPTEKLLEIVKNYYYHLQGGLPLEKFTQASDAAFEVLLRPVTPYLKNIDKLTVIPDWQLAKLPFGALIQQLPDNQQVNFDDLDYLIKHFEINYHYSASIWSKKRVAEPKGEIDFLAFAPFSNGQGEVDATLRYDGDPLPESATEVKTIFDFFRKRGARAKIYLANEATKSVFKRQCSQANIIHLASHSEYDRTNEHLTQISFAQEATNPQKNEEGVNAEANNELLVGSIYNLELKADLVVLSSCESGLGKSYKGEGMMSLSRSFLYAGARNIIFSYWRVNDTYSKDLMIAFYRGLLSQGYGYAKALQEAKQAFLSQGKNLPPKYWSSFAIVGD